MIIGLTGSYCSGKDTVAEYLVKKRKFAHYSLSDVIRDEMRSSGVEITRGNLIREGKKLREKLGNAALAVIALGKCGAKKRCIISSIRHPAEVKELRKRKGFVLVNVDAPAKLRFERMLKRNRENDPKTLAQFLEFEKRESQKKGSGQQVSRCMKMADLTFINDENDIKELHKKIDALLLRIKASV